MNKKKIKFATSNPHKVKEANFIGEKYGIEFIQIHIEYPEIRHEDVEVVAKKGVEYVFSKIKEAVIVEDTGLYIEALNGFPGAYSAFVFRKIGNSGILKLLSDVPKNERRAFFKSSVAFSDGKIVKTFNGVLQGRIAEEERGCEGFGYDPIFIPLGYEKTLAEIPALKAEISHRAQAFRNFCEWFSKAVLSAQQS
ncbi:MAG: non-canonical purine NTP pyrophosphatase, RdgB/HAM1 family [Candidatus Altiarchaeales archaeon]|nr:MAG: non-canonical purine NTP pyrophosphatase, RdgB/HAM1 family [Candidatus Altiarchaeales archaeon]